MKVLDKRSASSALKAFLSERNEYEHKHQLSHNDRNYNVRKKFKLAGILPKYTDDEALGDFLITPSCDLDLISSESLKKINRHLEDYNTYLKKEKIKGADESLIKRVRKPQYTPPETCGCFDCQKKTNPDKLTVNTAKKEKE